MNFKEAVKNTPLGRTENNAETYTSSKSPLVDFFFKGAAARNMTSNELVSMFTAAYVEQPRLAMQMLAWLRDIRGGAGERRAFRTILQTGATSSLISEDYMEALIAATPEYGRFDDVLCLLNTKYEISALTVISKGMLDAKTRPLCAKWMPRKGPIAAHLAKAFEMTPRQWRKSLSSNSNTVEQLMCAQKWESIEYSKVPSVASSRYRKAFSRHDPKGYAGWAEKAAAGEVKVNASAIFPHDVIKGVFGVWGNPRDFSVAEVNAIQAQWDALPNYMGEDNILPVVDTSGSMFTPVSGEAMAIDISVSLGYYVATRQKGAFSNIFMTFSQEPQFVQVPLTGNIVQRMRAMSNAAWGYNTNLQASITLLLKAAMRGNVSQENMPNKLLIISDMEFDQGASGTNMNQLRDQYQAAGYEMPGVVYWNVNSRQRHNVPVQIHETGTALISGFSPSILKGVLSGDLNPVSVCMKTIDVPRYQIF